MKDLVSYEWSKLISLNVGYNNIGNEGFKVLTTIQWPSLKTLYACTLPSIKASTTSTALNGLPPTFASSEPCHFPATKSNKSPKILYNSNSFKNSSFVPFTSSRQQSHRTSAWRTTLLRRTEKLLHLYL